MNEVFVAVYVSPQTRPERAQRWASGGHSTHTSLFFFFPFFNIKRWLRFHQPQDMVQESRRIHYHPQGETEEGANRRLVSPLPLDNQTDEHHL